MVSSSPQTYSVSDYVEWFGKGQLVLDPDFQRGSVWTATARTFLIDTILKGFPIPQVFLRTRINTATKSTIREIVDGQQRMRAILDFASDKMRLSQRSNEFHGMTYSSLPDDQKQAFLSYNISTVQIINAQNEDILEIFARLNSYSVKVTPPELRHAKYSEPVKWAIWDRARKWRHFMSHYKVLSVRDFVRLKDNSFVAELFNFAENGVSDGGESKIDAYYRSHKSKDEEFFVALSDVVDSILEVISNDYADLLQGGTFMSAPNLLTLYTVIGYQRGLIPENDASRDVDAGALKGLSNGTLVDIFLELSAAVENKEVEGPHAGFISASTSSTQRISTRKTRLKTIVEMTKRR